MSDDDMLQKAIARVDAQLRAIDDSRADQARRAALWDSIGAPAVAFLRSLVDYGAVTELKLMEQSWDVDALAENIRALLARAEEQP